MALHPVYPALTASVQVVSHPDGPACSHGGSSAVEPGAPAAAGRLGVRVVLTDERRGVAVTYAEGVDPGEEIAASWAAGSECRGPRRRGELHGALRPRPRRYAWQLHMLLTWPPPTPHPTPTPPSPLTPAADHAAFLPYLVQGCVAWNSGDGWLMLFDDNAKLAAFVGAVLRAAQLAQLAQRGG